MGWGDKWFEEAAQVDPKVWEDALLHGGAFTKVSLDKTDTLKIEHIERAKLYLNMSPTHDPYTNPNAHIYYECNCGAVLDPQTKSFAALNNYASEKGWKIRFTDKGYVPYCVKCGEGVE